jgi:predicted nucleic acid-binding protein
MQAYVDTSVVLALAFRQARPETRERVFAYKRLLASTLLEAEMLSACRRERVEWDPAFLEPIKWLTPERRLTEELGRVYNAGYLRGADAWHVACALHATDSPTDLDFLTLDRLQRDVAAKLGFPTP